MVNCIFKTFIELVFISFSRVLSSLEKLSAMMTILQVSPSLFPTRRIICSVMYRSNRLINRQQYLLGSMQRTLSKGADRNIVEDRPPTPILDSFTLSQEEGFDYVESVLGIKSANKKLQRDRLGLLTEIVGKTYLTIPYQNISNILGIPPNRRRIPSFDEVKDSMFSRQGGACYELNIFTNR